MRDLRHDLWPESDASFCLYSIGSLAFSGFPCRGNRIPFEVGISSRRIAHLSGGTYHGPVHVLFREFVSVSAEYKHHDCIGYDRGHVNAGEAASITGILIVDAIGILLFG